ncbi:ThiF family protein [Microbacterium sp. SLBN-154]|uniref:HesA/MoeB/ThiF family protein n=1 Tax=Microbacterium sp. SLBN-154 TaxID=2768458 RepID=UPI0011509895|nr:ThiF family adenylyltransferase [Microbacterium sp. SLBN-154]TQK17947.1 ThiF family protein [Microbacterium sp. SLBN-154]
MRNAPHVMVPRDALSKIASSLERSGDLAFRHVPSDDLFVVSVVETAPSVRQQVDIPRQYSALRSGDALFHGKWVRTPGGLANLTHLQLLQRPGTMLPHEDATSLFGVSINPGAQISLVLTHDSALPEELRKAGVQEFAGWAVTREGAFPYPTSLEPEILGLSQLSGLWPLAETASLSIAVVGCGSIGSVAADALAGYGVGALHLIDNDRLLWHNLIRHRLGPESVGRFKSAALADAIQERWTNDNVVSHPIDVVRSADVFRSVIREVNLVLCAADGIAPRRVVSHAARRAGVPAVLACVLDQGAIGEIVRLRPSPRFGCLLCLRAQLAGEGAMDAEADQELAYGTGEVHQPMTASPGDLQAVGIFAAKAAIATHLESRYGDSSQLLPGEHAVLGLRPQRDLVPPFNLEHAGEVRWSSIPPPREGCPTCNP